MVRLMLVLAPALCCLSVDEEIILAGPGVHCSWCIPYGAPCP